MGQHPRAPAQISQNNDQCAHPGSLPRLCGDKAPFRDLLGGVGPMLGQAHHFRNYAPEKIQYAIDRYTNEATRLYNVIDKRLADHEYLAGEYSIADMATFPWLRSYENQGQKLEDYPNLKRWFEAIYARPAVERGCKVLADRRRSAVRDEKSREMLFGASQYQRR